MQRSPCAPDLGAAFDIRMAQLTLKQYEELPEAGQVDLGAGRWHLFFFVSSLWPKKTLNRERCKGKN